MKITKPARPERSRGASAPAPATNHLPFGPAGKVLREGGCEEVEAAEAWLRHVKAGRIGGAPAGS